MSKKLNVVLVGLGFGGQFVPIYRDHPNVASVGLFDPNRNLMEFYAKRHSCDKTYNNFEEVIEDKSVDAVHLISPIPLHEEQTLKVLESGKHCASTVPMSLSLEGIKKIVKLVRRTGKNYMMMETAVYTRHFFHVREMIKNGEFGRIQFLRGAHYQDMEHWPDYWMGFPPMYYGTHAIAPLVMAAESKIIKTHCFGSGVMREELTKRYNNPYPIECAIFEFENGLKAEVTRSLFAMARIITESFNIYGEKRTFEWQQIEEEKPVVFTLGESVPNGQGGFWRGLPCTYERIELKDRADLLPKEITKYTIRRTYQDKSNPQVTFEEGGGHDGSHPHMVHEFITSILEERKAWVNEIVAANITAAGICAHESAMNGGKEVIIPDFSKLDD
mgnify:CR=1 FL=1